VADLYTDYGAGMPRRKRRVDAFDSAPTLGLARRDTGGYAGTLDQQYNQALGLRPRYVASNAGAQRLNDLYDQSFGYTT